MPQYDDITQVPFVGGQAVPQPVLANVPTDALAAQITGERGGDNLPTEPLIAYQQAMKVKDRTDAAQKAQSDLAASDAQQNSFMPKLIVTLAALKGDFRPWMQLEEQKRKTAVGKALFPTQLKINEYVSQGDYESAENLATTAYQAAGSRSSELMPYFQQIQKEISAKRTQIQNMKTRYEMLKLAVGDDKENPNYKFVQALGAFMKNPTPDSEAGFNEFMSMNKPQTNISDVKAVTVSPLTQQISETPLTQYAPPSAADTISGKEVVQVHQLKSTADITNLQKGIGVTDINGQVITPDSQRAQNIIQEMSTRQKDEAAYELKKMIVTDPLLNSAFIAAGGKIKDLATGNIKREDMTKAFDVILQRKITEAEATALANIKVNPYMWAATGGTFVDKNLNEHPLKTVYNAEEQGLTPARQKVFDDRIVPLKTRIQGLDYAAEMVSEMKRLGTDLSTPAERFSMGVKRLVGGWLGVSFDEKATAAETIAAIMNRAVEDVQGGLKNMDRPSATIGRIKKFTAGDFGSPEDAVQSLTILQGQLKQELLNSIAVVPQTALPSVPGKAAPSGKITRGDVEGALKKYGTAPTPGRDQEAERYMTWLRNHGYLQEVPQDASGTPTAPPTGAPTTAPTAPAGKYTTPKGKAYKNIQVE